VCLWVRESVRVCACMFHLDEGTLVSTGRHTPIQRPRVPGWDAMGSRGHQEGYSFPAPEERRDVDSLKQEFGKLQKGCRQRCRGQCRRRGAGRQCTRFNTKIYQYKNLFGPAMSVWNVLPCVAVCCCVWNTHCIENCTATHCNTLQHSATHCNTLHHTVTRCNTLQHTAHTATYCNSL